MKEEKPTSLKIEITNIDSEQAHDIVVLLKTMQYLGRIGATRVIHVWCDGDGAFRPTIKTNLPWEDEIKHKELDNTVDGNLKISIE